MTNQETTYYDTLIRQHLKELKPYSSARHEYDGDSKIFLDANELPYESDFNRYPDPLQKTLKERLAIIKSCSANQLFIGNGSDECIDLLIRLFCEPGMHSIVTCPPTYGMYNVSAQINNVNVSEVPLMESYDFNVPALCEIHVDQSPLMFICSPNNPTGNSLAIVDLKSILKGYEGIVVVDEAYIDFSDHSSAVKLLAEYPRLVVLQTLSKAYGLAGLRLGLCFANPNLIRWLNKIKPPYNINTAAQSKALKYLDNMEIISQRILEIQSERKRLKPMLEAYTFVKSVFSSDGNFLLLKVEDANALYTYLIQHEIVVRNRSSVLGCDESLRITIGTKDENNELLNVLSAYGNSTIFK